MLFFLVWITSALLTYEKSLDLTELTVSGDGCSFSYEEYCSSGIPEDYLKVVLSGITELLGGTFQNSYSLKEIVLCSTISKIENKCFKNCEKLESVDIPNGVAELFDETFSNCQNLKFITFPLSLKYIQEGNTFLKCFKIEKFIVKEGNRYFSTLYNNKLLIENGTIARCWAASDSTVFIPKEIRTICQNFLNGITSSKKIDFEESSSLKTVSKLAFYRAGFTEVRFPEGVEVLETTILSETNAHTVYLPKSLISVSVSVFGGMYNLQKVEVSEGCKAVNVQGDIILDSKNESLIFFPKTAKSFHIEKTILNIDLSVIRKNQNLTTLTTAPNHSVFYAKGNVLYKDKNKTLIANSGGNKIVEVIESCTTIASKAFEGSIIERVTFKGNSFLFISDSAFLGCNKLIYIELPECLQGIGRWSFMRTKLKSLTFPSTITKMSEYSFSGSSCEVVNLSLCSLLTSIEYNTFSDCNSLEVVILSQSIQTINLQSFYKCSKLTSISIPGSVQSLEKEVFAFSALSKIIFEGKSKLTSIGDSCFSNTQLIDIDIPDSVVSIGKKSFSDCKNLVNIRFSNISNLQTIEENIISNSNLIKTIYLGPNVTTILPTALSEAYGLQDVIVSIFNTKFESQPAVEDPKTSVLYTKQGKEFVLCPGGIENVNIAPSVNKIQSNAFFKCKYLKNVTFDSESPLSSIGAATFYGCEMITSLHFPRLLQCIEEEAFSGCSKLEKVSFASQCILSEIKSKAFNGCTMLRNFEFPSQIKKIHSESFSNCVSLHEVFLPNTLTEIMSKSFSECSNLVRAISCITSEPDAFASNAFSGCHKDFAFVVSALYKLSEVTPTVCGMTALRLLDSDCNFPSAVFTTSTDCAYFLVLGIINFESGQE